MPLKVGIVASSLFHLTLSLKEMSKKERILSWLEAPDPSKIHNRILEEHHEGTGEWFLNSEMFESWNETPCATLWVRGIRMLPPILWKCLDAHRPTGGMCSRQWEDRILVRNII
jgi:hypothetical protein